VPESNEQPAAPSGNGTPTAQTFFQTLVTCTPRTYVTPAIVALNVIVFVVMVIAGVHLFSPEGEDLIAWGANFSPRTAAGEWWRLLTAMFVHVGLLHVAMNMYVLWGAGQLVERLVGNIGFTILYLLSGLVGSVVSAWWNPVVISAGASGAVFGVYGALFASLVRHRRSIPKEVLVRLRNGAILFLGFNLYFGLAHPQIDMAAHVGGLVAGFVSGLLLAHPLTPEALRGRWRRNLVLLMAGGGVVAAGAWLMPRRLADVQDHLEQVARVEERCIKTWGAGIKRWEKKEITDAQLVAIIQEQVLPRWRTARGRIDGMRDIPKPVQAHVEKLLRYMDLRQQGWELQVEALQQKDAGKLRRAVEKHQQAMSLFEDEERSKEDKR
jgi:rhomboid protease GluP